MEEQTILKQKQEQIEAFLQSKMKYSSSKKKHTDRSRSSSASPGPRYQYHKKENNLRLDQEISSFQNAQQKY